MLLDHNNHNPRIHEAAYIALGSNNLFGGTVGVGIHIDGVMKAPTMWIDDRKIMENGELLIAI